MLSLRIKKCHCPLIHYWLNWVKSSCLTLKLFGVTDYHTCLWETMNELSVWEVSKFFSIYNRKTKKLGYFSQYKDFVSLCAWRWKVLAHHFWTSQSTRAKRNNHLPDIYLWTLFLPHDFLPRKITWNPEEGCCFLVRKLTIALLNCVIFLLASTSVRRAGILIGLVLMTLR